MQGFHQQQHHLVALLSAALKHDPSMPSSSSDGAEESRLAAIRSLHAAIIYPSNATLVAHSASFIFQGLSQLLADNSNAVRHMAVKSYGALCSKLCSACTSSNGRKNHVMVPNMADNFIGWLLPLLKNNNSKNGDAEVALDGVLEFLNVGDVSGIDRYVLPILKAAQELLEDEKTSWNLLCKLLRVLILISSKFSRYFQPHFVDIVDLLLGWALLPDPSVQDRQVIMDSFAHFQKYWVTNINFSVGLLSKFVGDMEALLQVECSGMPHKFQRFLALFSCFSGILKSSAYGLMETNSIEQITGPLGRMIPQFFDCISTVGRKFGWLKWFDDCWKCLTLLAEILRERFSKFYPLALSILFESLVMIRPAEPIKSDKCSALRICGVLNANYHMLSLQKLALLPSSVQKVLQFESPISHLRLNPNHLVVACVAATYVFLLQHENNEVVKQGISSLIEDLKNLKGILIRKFLLSQVNGSTDSKIYSEFEILQLILFDLKVLLSCIYLGETPPVTMKPETAGLYLERSELLSSLIIDELYSPDVTLYDYVELHLNVINTIRRVSAVEIFSRFSLEKQSNMEGSEDIKSADIVCENIASYGSACTIIAHLRKYWMLFENSFCTLSSVSVKVETLEWIRESCTSIIHLHNNLSGAMNFSYKNEQVFLPKFLSSLVDMASDQESQVRFRVALVFEILMHGEFLHPFFFYSLSQVFLERLGDPDQNVKDAFTKLFSQMLSMAVYAHGQIVCGTPSLFFGDFSIKRPSLCWKQLFTLEQLPQHLRSQQLAAILSYISQTWKAPLSSWIQRLIQNSYRTDDATLSSQGGKRNTHASVILKKHDFLKSVSKINDVAAVWWAIHESARYCIVNRLRTNLGGPTQTFAGLERLLLDVPNIIYFDAAHSDSNLNPIGSSKQLLPMRLLLEFVEALKKNAFNAYNECTVMQSATRQCVAFFRANQKVCEEWFSRMSEPIVNAALAIRCNDATIQYCSLRLLDLKILADSVHMGRTDEQIGDLPNWDQVFEDIFKMLCHMALALCRDHDSKTLMGLQKWASASFSFMVVNDNPAAGRIGTLDPFSWITGLVYMAEGQYENAAAHFIYLLQNEDALSLMGSDGVQFAVARTVECFSAVSDWKSLETWLLELHVLRGKHAGKAYSGALTSAGIDLNAIQALSRFDNGDLQAAWACLDLTPKSNNDFTLDPKIALQRSEQMLLQAMLFHEDGKADKVLPEIQKAKQMLEEVISVLPLDGLSDASAVAIQLHCINSFEEGCKTVHAKHEQGKQLYPMSPSCLLVLQLPVSKAYQDCNYLLKVLRVYRTIFPCSLATVRLCNSLISLSRRQRNFGLIGRLNTVIKDLSSSCVMKMRDDFMLHLQYEAILLMYAEGKIGSAIKELLEFVHPCICSSTDIISDATLGYLKATACLKLSKWLKQDYLLLMNSVDSMPRLKKYFNASRSFCTINDHISDDNSDPKIFFGIIDEIVGFALKSATHLCPSMGKAWISYARWCYDRARTILDSAHCDVFGRNSVLSTDQDSMPEELTEEETSRVKSSILQFVGKRDIVVLDSENEKSQASFGSERPNWEPVDFFIQKILCMIQTTSGHNGVEKLNGEYISSFFERNLRLLINSSIKSIEASDIESLVALLLAVWWPLRRRRVSLFGHAACGFLRFFSFSCTSRGWLTSFDLDIKSGSYTLMAVLFVLNILLNYGVELKDMLQPALSASPLMPWQEITPQLFARVSSHPEEVVRKQLEGLLIMLAKSSPWTIVYPTLVDISSYDETPPEELQNILVFLQKLYPKLVHNVELLMKELGSVTILWEELWLSTIQDLHSDVVRRINILKEEAGRTEKNSSLSRIEKQKINSAKYSAIMAPIIISLERGLATTSKKPETPYEMWFSREYMEKIKVSISRFKNVHVSSTSLEDVWKPFENIAATMVASRRKSSVLLSEVAPRLSLLSSSDIPVPGLEKQSMLSSMDGVPDATHSGIVNITSFSEQVLILPTKTKPKKLVIMGSDGEKYPYLLKGREDLRLDARIMQLLQAINGLLLSSVSVRDRCLNIRHYSVTPISGRSGLIQWVDNITSLYSIFNTWQKCAQLPRMSTHNAGDGKADPVILRPSDMFYGKIIPALKERGIKKVISRSDWPIEVKRKVLLDLMKEVPRKLLYQELWCASEGFKGFSSKLKRYSGSVAVMSIVGYILGLGDRHLDNILIDFSTGDIVHIDYNVCFDKGQRLKIPEVVPFRLTHTMEASLGLTGTEGAFRSDCEGVLALLRKNKDVLLMLLEVFVWDPLVEWTCDDFHDDVKFGGEEWRGMEMAVCFSIFSSRMQEIHGSFQEHGGLLMDSLQVLTLSLSNFNDVLNHYQLASVASFHAEEEKCNLLISHSNVQSSVTQLTGELEEACLEYEVQRHELFEKKEVVSELVQYAVTFTEKHKMNLDAIRSGSILESAPRKHFFVGHESISLISAVVLAGIPLTVIPEPTFTLCSDVDREIFHFFSELVQGHYNAVAMLREYSLALEMVLPINYHKSSQVSVWADVLQLAVNPVSSITLPFAVKQADALLAAVRGDRLSSVEKIRDDLCLEVKKCSDEMERVSDLLKSVVSDEEHVGKDGFMSHFVDWMRYYCGLSWENDAPLKLQRENIIDGQRLKLHNEDDKKRIFSLLGVSVMFLFDAISCHIKNFLKEPASNECSNGHHLYGFKWTYSILSEKLEMIMLITGFCNEVQSWFGISQVQNDENATMLLRCLEGNSLLSVIKDALVACQNLSKEIFELSLRDVTRHAVSNRSEAMGAFCLLSEVQHSINVALEPIINIEAERASLVELEKKYFVSLGLLSEKQLALEEASGRDELSWEEAEELASQREICTEQLNELDQSWSQRDCLASSFIDSVDAVKNSLDSCERHLEDDVLRIDAHSTRRKHLLSSFFKLFSTLELTDKTLSAFRGQSFGHADIVKPGQSVWKISSVSDSHGFFIWKVNFVHSFLDSCLNDAATLLHENVCYYQLFSALKKRMVDNQVGEALLDRYLKDRIAPTLIACLDRGVDAVKQIQVHLMEENVGSVEQLKHMLNEYCIEHQTVQESRRVSLEMQAQISEMSALIENKSLEAIHLEWMHTISSSQKHLHGHEYLHPTLLNLARPKLLEGLESTVMKIEKSVEGLQSCVAKSKPIEVQLEKVMSWVSGRSDQGLVKETQTKHVGIPQEFHDHVMERHDILSNCCSEASEMMKICKDVLEFEASRDGAFFSPGGETILNGSNWKKSYMSALMRLRNVHHSFSRAEQEWTALQSSMDAASALLSSTEEELHVASAKAGSASGELESSRGSVTEAGRAVSRALREFAEVRNVHAVSLTSDCASLLEEMLTASEGMRDVHVMVEQTAAVHSSLMEDLARVTSIVEEAMTDEDGGGSTLTESCSSGVQEACSALNPLVSTVDSRVKNLHSMLTRLSTAASLHAGNLHEAFAAGEDARADLVSHSKDADRGGSPEEVSAGDWLSPPETLSSGDSGHSTAGTSSGSSKGGGGGGGVGVSRLLRGRNAYAVSCLQRVEMKLDGWRHGGGGDSPNMTVAEEVDLLIKQATSVDNLCNMYEGWTPWI